MRVIGQVLLAVCVSGTPALIAQAPDGAGPPDVVDARAQKVLADARVALGGETALSSIRSLTTTGRTRRVQGNNLVPIEFELLVELPDKYLRKDEIPAQESDPTTTGFNGESLLQIPAPTPPQPRPGMPTPPAGRFEAMLETRLLTARQDLARLMLGMFAMSFDAYPLTFKYIGQAETPEAEPMCSRGRRLTTSSCVSSSIRRPVCRSWCRGWRLVGRCRRAAAHRVLPPAPVPPRPRPLPPPNLSPRLPSTGCIGRLPRGGRHQALLPTAPRHRREVEG